MVYHVAPITIVGRPNPASQKVSYFKREKNMTVTTKDKPISVKTIFAAGAILIVGLGLGKTLVSINETLGQVSLTLMIAFQLYVPYWLYERAGLNPEAEGLNVHGLIHRPLQTTALLSDLKRVMVLVLFTFPPFAIGHHFFQVHIGGHTQGYTFQLPPDLLLFVIFQVLLVALPEELFYRGFMLVSLEKIWPNQTFLLGIPVGRAVIVSSIFFALAHFVGEYNFLRLGPFFPAFLFSYLMLRSRSLFGCLTYHALSNVFSQILFVGYQAG